MALPAIEKAIEIAAVAVMMSDVVKDILKPVILPLPDNVDTSPPILADPVPVQTKVEPLITPAFESAYPNNTASPVPVQSKAEPLIFPNVMESGGVCGMNMSCAIEEKKSLPIFGIPNATELKWKNGAIEQARTRDAAGNPKEDIDFTDHGNPALHDIPHRHKWEPNEDGSYDKNSRKLVDN